MSNEAKKANAFIKEVLARITGDNAEATANKIARKALCAVESQISGLKSQINDQEDVVADKAEALENAIYPKEAFENGKSYVAAVSAAYTAHEDAKECLEDLNTQLKFWVTTLENRF